MSLAGDIKESIKTTAPDIYADSRWEKIADGIASAFGYEDAWTSFAPSWTNLTVGSGTNTGYYKQIGKTVFMRVYLKFAADTSVSGDIYLEFPIPIKTHDGITYIGGARLRDANVATSYQAMFQNNRGFTAFNSSGTYSVATSINATVPFTWATNDEIEVQCIYEAE